jgi:predicted transcriptional regulator
MQLNEMLKHIIKEKKHTQTTFANTVGTTQSAIGNALKRNDLYVSTLIKWCELNGYEVVIQEKKSGRRRDDQIVLSQKEE